VLILTDDWITTGEACSLSGYHAEHIRYLVRENKVIARKFGRLWQISRSDLARYIQEAQQTDDKRYGAHSLTSDDHE